RTSSSSVSSPSTVRARCFSPARSFSLISFAMTWVSSITMDCCHPAGSAPIRASFCRSNFALWKTHTPYCPSTSRSSSMLTARSTPSSETYSERREPSCVRHDSVAQKGSSWNASPDVSVSTAMKPLLTPRDIVGRGHCLQHREGNALRGSQLLVPAHRGLELDVDVDAVVVLVAHSDDNERHLQHALAFEDAH